MSGQAVSHEPFETNNFTRGKNQSEQKTHLV